MSGRWKADNHHPAPSGREPLWAVTDETMRNWLKQAVRRAEVTEYTFLILVTPHTFLAQLYHAHALSPPAPEGYSGAGRSEDLCCLMEVYTRVFVLDMAATPACRSPVTVMTPRRSGYFPPYGYNVTHYSYISCWRNKTCALEIKAVVSEINCSRQHKL